MAHDYEAGAAAFGAVLRGDNERITVGAGSNVQENSVLHTDMGSPLTIGTDCTIGHNAIIRTSAFIEHCGLPTLSGQAPLNSAEASGMALSCS